jgi:phosphoribosylamine--glycine ligase
MIGPAGPKVLEFNCRFGDPETEAVLVRLAEGEHGDLLAALTAVARGEAPRPLAFTDTVSTTVVMAQAGYPGSLAPPVRIGRLDEAEEVPGVVVFHAGTRQEGEILMSSGGRVLAVTAVGADASEARARAYQAADRIEMPGAQLRRDIGARSTGFPSAS